MASKSVFWRRLWKMKALNKIKILLWRTCSETLPTRCNLLRRKVLDDPTCPQCGVEIENTMQAKWECKQLLTIWEKGIWMDFEGPPSDLAFYRPGSFSWRASETAGTLFSTVAWSIWCRRNKVRCNEPSVPLGKILESVASLLMEFQSHTRSGVKALT
ncbi:uncharacterized protein LOC142634880 [Castanea sativa]|uniref:uncharacterized protein LOC142634880 n=1 Tax=Castanea sativa TaxID=21020 RepID=UPI003F65499D